ncbi:MAG: HAD-superfamily hydrolase, subfamily IA, variant 3 family protein [Microgenomates group bacterium GW2011_GWA2_40_6]|nr:MAG: HAD-superfamily hydrolase, subfamily IA, variant 3 family protein [Microgenomates group bacterium GW2011_GWA2_40_6]
MIKFVYFDVGGVVELDFSGTNKWEELKKEIGVTPELRDEYDKLWSEIEKRLCVDLDADVFFEQIKKHFQLNTPSDYSFLLNGFVNRFETNPSIWPAIQEISQKCPVGLLTNMYVNMFPAIQKRGLLPPVVWRQIIDSSVVKLRKPDLEIYHLAQKRANVPDSEILFIDNQPKNLDPARDLGWQTFLYDPANSKNSNQKLLKLWKSLR